MKNAVLSNSSKIIFATVLSSILMTACSTNAQTKDADKEKATITKKDSNVETALKKSLSENLKASGVETEITHIEPTKMAGIYWVDAKGLPSFFADKSGQFIVQGQIIKIGGKTPVDISAEITQKKAKNILATIDKKDMIIYKPKGTVKGVVYAFTDIDCGYCRKLHSEMKEINDAGIEVRYLAWPRSPQTIPSMTSIWCAKDPVKAMNTAKTGGAVKPATCESPIKKQVDIGFQLGVTGTPALFTEGGDQIGGYLAAQRLAKAVIESKK